MIPCGYMALLQRSFVSLTGPQWAGVCVCGGGGGGTYSTVGILAQVQREVCFLDRASVGRCGGWGYLL